MGDVVVKPWRVVNSAADVLRVAVNEPKPSLVRGYWADDKKNKIITKDTTKQKRIGEKVFAEVEMIGVPDGTQFTLSVIEWDPTFLSQDDDLIKVSTTVSQSRIHHEFTIDDTWYPDESDKVGEFYFEVEAHFILNGQPTDLEGSFPEKTEDYLYVCDKAIIPLTAELLKIQRNYQVKDDVVRVWEPKLFGEISVSYFIGDENRREITATEGKLLDNLTRDRGILGLQRFREIHDIAFSVSESYIAHNGLFPLTIPINMRDTWTGNDGHRDAFRHSYWNALLTKEFGYDWTLQFATAHEAAPGNPSLREAMDLFNNEVGRNVARNNPKATDNDLAVLINNELNAGHLIVINSGGNIAWSNTVNRWEHGLAANTTIPGVINIPDGTATAKQATAH